MSFSFDISYKICPNQKDNEELESTILNITKHYISCTWYAADSDGISNNLGFQIPQNEIDNLEEIIKKVNSTPNIYIDFIVANNPGSDSIDIYRSAIFLSRCYRREYLLEYKQQVKELQTTNPCFFKLNQLCTRD